MPGEVKIYIVDKREITLSGTIFTLRNLFDFFKREYNDLLNDLQISSYKQFKTKQARIRDELKDFEEDYEDEDSSFFEVLLGESNLISESVWDIIPSPEVEGHPVGDGGYGRAGVNVVETPLSPTVREVAIMTFSSTEEDYRDYNQEECRARGYIISIIASDDDQNNLLTTNYIKGNIEFLTAGK